MLALAPSAPTTQNPQLMSCPALVVSPRQPDVVCAGAYQSGIYASTNGGASWTLINNGLRNRAVRALTISSSGGVVYAGTYGEGIFRLGTP